MPVEGNKGKMPSLRTPIRRHYKPAGSGPVLIDFGTGPFSCYIEAVLFQYFPYKKGFDIS